MKKNITIDSDAYKLCHWKQYPEKLNKMYSYGESRIGSKFPFVCLFGLSAIIQDHFLQRVTDEMIEEGIEESYLAFGTTEFFNKEVWKKVRDIGYLPIRIKAAKEGSIIPISNVLFTLESTEPWFAKTANALETLLMHVWYPTTIATNSMYIYNDLKPLVEQSGSEFLLPFMVHDFSMRGVTCYEQGLRGGAAHLIWFEGSDTMSASRYIRDHYGMKGRLKSVWATEHSVATSFGPGRGEIEYVKHQLLNAPDDKIVSLVLDSYDTFNFCENVLGDPEIKEMIIKREGRVVGRPDSGVPKDVINRCLSILGNVYGTSTNSKHFNVINHNVGLLQGDGMRRETITDLYKDIISKKWSSDNLVVGSGGGLMQENINRDTQRFAIKASYTEMDSVPHNVQKDPKTSDYKKSKTGKLKLVNDGEYQRDHTVSSVDEKMYAEANDLLETVFENGVVKHVSFKDVIEQSRKDLHLLEKPKLVTA